MTPQFIFLTLLGLLISAPKLKEPLTPVYIPHGSASMEKFEMKLFELLPIYALGVEPRQEIIASAIPRDAIPQSYRNDVTERMKKVLKPDMMPPVLDNLQWSGYRKLAWRTNYIITTCADPEKELHVLLVAGASGINVTVTSKIWFNEEVTSLTSEKIVESASKILRFPAERVPAIEVEHKETIIEGVPVCFGIMRCEFDDTAPLIQPKEWWRRIPFWITKGKMYMNIWTEEYMRASEADPWKF